jgi:predicted PolB exonuclease-like 3'-5' exonuclease
VRKLDLLWLPRKPDDPGEQTEVSILSKFLGAVGKAKPQLVGFNSRSSDLKILVQRAVVNGLAVPDFCRRPDKPWEGCDYFARDNEWHIDMMEILGSWGGKSTVSLNEIARLSGIPGKFGTCGDDVAGLWLAGRWREIVEYNCFDALTTYLVWLRIAHFSGLFTPEQYAEEEQEVRDLIFELAAQPETAFVERYLEEWDRLQELLPGK